MTASSALWIFVIISVIIIIKIAWQQSLKDGSESNEIDNQQINVNGYVNADSSPPSGGLCGDRYGCTYYINNLCSGCRSSYAPRKCPYDMTRRMPSGTRPQCEYCFRHYSEWEHCYDPTQAPTISPTKSPTASPTDTPTTAPTKSPTSAPTTKTPTESPTLSPTISPTASPTYPWKFEYIHHTHSWEEAETYCNQNYEGGHLAAFHDFDDINNILKDPGLIWLGFDRSTRKWLDGTDVSNDDWNAGFFKTFDWGCPYARRMDDGRLVWHPMSCSSRQDFVCQYPDK